MMLPLPCPCMTRTSCFMLRITPRTFVVERRGIAFRGLVRDRAKPGLRCRHCSPRHRDGQTVRRSCRPGLPTSSSWRTSAWMKAASAPKRRSSASRAFPSALPASGNDETGTVLGKGQSGGATDACEGSL